MSDLMNMRPVNLKRDKQVRGLVLLLGLVLVAMLGCIPEGGPTPGGGFSSVSGTVLDQSFSMYSGVAESVGSGYLITLTDSSSYSCTSTPSGDYLRVIFEAGEEGATASASGNVTFSSVEGNLDVSEGATAGSVTITEIDATFGTISGDLSASNATSDVSGTFTVDICP